MGKYCPKCGQELIDNAKFCKKCGQAVEGGQDIKQPAQQVNVAPQSQQYQFRQNVVEQLSGKLKTVSVFWLIAGGLQFILSMVFIVKGFDDNIPSFMQGIMFLVIAILNTFIAMRYFKYGKEINIRPISIITKYSSVSGCIGMLFYSIVFGGIIGIVGAIYTFVVRGFVRANEMQFAQIEQQFMKKGVIEA